LTARAGEPPGRPPSGASPDEPEERLTREVTLRAIRRLGILEGVILITAVVLALLAGALAAFLLGELLGTPFRVTWAAASLFLFVVPGLLIWVRDRAT
jgi:hypothetical protein